MKLNNNVVKTIVTYVLFAVVVASIALIISGIFDTHYISVNWVKLLIGGAVLYAIEYTCGWLFPKKK